MLIFFSVPKLGIFVARVNIAQKMAVIAKSAREDFEKKKFYGSEKVLRGKIQTLIVWPLKWIIF